MTRRDRLGWNAAAVVARDAGGTIAVKERKKDTARGAWTGRGAAPPDEEGGPRGAQRRPAPLSAATDQGATVVGAAACRTSIQRMVKTGAAGSLRATPPWA